MELKNNQLFRAMEWLTSTVEGCSQAVCVLGESCSLDLFSKSALSSKGWRKVNPKGKFHGWGRSQKLRKRRKTGWKGYCLWGRVILCCEEAPCDFQSRGEKGNLLKKNQAEKFRHKDASVWISTATVKQNMAGTSSDPSWLFQNILIMRHTHNVFRIPSVLPLGQLI